MKTDKHWSDHSSSLGFILSQWLNGGVAWRKLLVLYSVCAWNHNKHLARTISTLCHLLTKNVFVSSSLLSGVLRFVPSMMLCELFLELLSWYQCGFWATKFLSSMIFAYGCMRKKSLTLNSFKISVRDFNFRRTDRD